MCFLSVLTVLKYKQINNFKANSTEYSVIVAIDKDKIEAIKKDIEMMTYNSVSEEKMENGRYRLKIKCPPEKLPNIKMFILNKSDNLEVEDEWVN